MRKQKTPNQNSKKKNEPPQNEYDIRSLWDNFKCTNVSVMGNGGRLEGEEREQEIENLFEKIMTENFPNLVNETDIQVQEVQIPNKMNPKRPTPR